MKKLLSLFLLIVATNAEILVWDSAPDAVAWRLRYGTNNIVLQSPSFPILLPIGVTAVNITAIGPNGLESLPSTLTISKRSISGYSSSVSTANTNYTTLFYQ